MKVRQMMQEHRHIENWRKDNNPLIRFQALKIKEETVYIFDHESEKNEGA